MKKYLIALATGIVLIGLIVCGAFINFNSTKANDTISSDDGVVAYIYVDIKGAIKNPAVYRVTSQTRLFQLIEIAGGLTSDADTSKINLSKKLSDEESIYVSFIGDEISETNDNLININTATIEELDKLPGIGLVTAQAIVEYRQTIGPFLKITDIMNVSGIGESSFEKIKDYIKI